MSDRIDPDALASALPEQVGYDIGPWDIDNLARFQAERLAEAGYRLVHEELSPAEAGFGRIMSILRDYAESGVESVNIRQILDLGDPHGMWTYSTGSAP